MVTRGLGWIWGRIMAPCGGGTRLRAGPHRQGSTVGWAEPRGRGAMRGWDRAGWGPAGRVGTHGQGRAGWDLQMLENPWEGRSREPVLVLGPGMVPAVLRFSIS